MSHIHRTINRYYETFESYQGVISVKSGLVWACGVSTIFCFISIYILVFEQATLKKIGILNVSLYFLGLMILFELLALIYWTRIVNEKNKRIISFCQTNLMTKEKNIYELKKLWLKRTLQCPSTEYLLLVKQLEYFVILRGKYKPVFELNGKSILTLIYTTDLKPHLYALFLGVFATTIALSIASGANLDNIFDLFNAISSSFTFFNIFVLSIFLLTLLTIVRYISLIITQSIEHFLWRIGGENSFSKSKANMFIKELIDQHTLAKGKFRTKALIVK